VWGDCLEGGLYLIGLKYDGVTVYGPAYSEGNMWATVRAFEHNNLDRMTLIPAPKYGHTLLRSRARTTSISYHLIEEQRRNPVGFTFQPDGLPELGRAGVL
jgi:hypothetical protein